MRPSSGHSLHGRIAFAEGNRDEARRHYRSAIHVSMAPAPTVVQPSCGASSPSS